MLKDRFDAYNLTLAGHLKKYSESNNINHRFIDRRGPGTEFELTDGYLGLRFTFGSSGKIF
jgi:hypothetical protein